MLLLEVCRLAPERLFLRVDVQRIGIDGPRRSDHALVRHRLGIVHPDRLPVLLVEVEMNRRLDDRLRRDGTALLFRPLRLGEPLLSREFGTVLLERGDTVGDDGVDLSNVALLLLQTTGGDPDLVRSRDCLARLVEDLTGAIRSLESCERQPELLRVRNDLDCAREQYSRIFRVLLELDRLFPQLDRSRNVLEGCVHG